MIEEQQHREPETPETESSELAIERERRKRAEFEFKTQREKREAQEMAEAIKQECFADELRRQLAATGLKFHCNDNELLQMLNGKMPDVKLLVKNDGSFSVEESGTPMEFKEVLTRFAVRCPYLIENREAIAHLMPKKEIRSRADLPANSDKQRYIQEFGLQAYENLSITHVPDVDKSQLTREIYLKASLAQKVAWGLTEAEIARLLHFGKIDGKR